MPALKCVNCSRLTESDELSPACPRCGSAVLLDWREVGSVSREAIEALPSGVWRYKALLPELPIDEVVTLGEGGTPLLPAKRIGEELGLKKLLIKDESRNPTGSFMDRGSTVLVSLARRRGVKECSCVTTGNLGASLAAYCAKAGISARIRIDPSTDRGKLYQMLAFGAQIEARSRSSEAHLPGRRLLAVTAGNPYLLEGEKTTSLEIAQELGWRVPDVIAVPVGTGGHLSMIWRGIEQLRDLGLIERSECRLLGVQFAAGDQTNGRMRLKAETFSGLYSTELEESEPIFRMEVARAISGSRGVGLTTTVTDAMKATGLLARTEGIFAEPASSSVIACLRTAAEKGLVRRDDTVVCVITGAGLKDTKAISRLAKATKKVAVREEYAAARMQIGHTKAALLRQLAEGPRYGYELWQALSIERRITTASVYQHLGELEELSLVRRSGAVTARGRERIPYELTRRGADFVQMAGRLGREVERRVPPGG